MVGFGFLVVGFVVFLSHQGFLVVVVFGFGFRVVVLYFLVVVSEKQIIFSLG